MKWSSQVNAAIKLDKTATPDDLKKGADVLEFSSWRRIEVAETEAGLHEIAEGITIRPIYKISWGRKQAGILKWWPFSKKVRTGKFVKSPIHDLVLPQEVGSRYGRGDKRKGINERAVFLSTCLKDSSLTAIFAIHTAESWVMLHHWRTSWTQLGLCRLSVCSF